MKRNLFIAAAQRHLRSFRTMVAKKRVFCLFRLHYKFWTLNWALRKKRVQKPVLLLTFQSAPLRTDKFIRLEKRRDYIPLRALTR